MVVELCTGSEHAGLDEGDADGKSLRDELVMSEVGLALLGVFNFLRGQVSEFMFVDGLLVVGVFCWPGAQIGDADLPALVDKYVLGADVTDLAAGVLEYVSGGSQGVDQVPHLGLGEVVVVRPPVLDFLVEQVRIIVEVDLS